MALVSSPLSKAFSQHVRSFRFVCLNGDLIGNRPGVSTFPVIHLELDGSCLALSLNFLKAPTLACIASFFNAEFQGVRKEPERIEQDTFPHPVFPNYRRHGCKRLVLSFIPQAP